MVLVGCVAGSDNDYSAVLTARESQMTLVICNQDVNGAQQASVVFVGSSG